MKITVKLERSTPQEMGPNGTKEQAERYDEMVQKSVILKIDRRVRGGTLNLGYGQTTVITEPTDKFLEAELLQMITETYVDVFKQGIWKQRPRKHILFP